MKLSAILLITLFFTGCAEFSKLKVEDDGYYRFKKLPIKETIAVRAPTECVPDMFVHETGENIVDFVMGRGYWNAFGQYAVVVNALSTSSKNDDTYFIEKSETFIKKYIEEDRKSLGFNIIYQGGKRLDVAGKVSYQGLGIAEGKAIFVATVTKHINSATIASLIYPIKEGSPKSTSDVLPWDCYNKFIESIKEEF